MQLNNKKNENIIKNFSMYVFSQQTLNSLSLSTVISNFGINFNKFAKEVDDLSINVPLYFLIKLKIVIFKGRTYKINFFRPPAFYFLNLLKYQKEYLVLENGTYKSNIFFCISIQNIVQLAKFYYSSLDLKKSVSMLLGTIKSSNLKIFLC